MAYLKRANDEVLVMTTVETPEAVADLDEILTVPGLDGIFIGPMDLSTSMGHFADASQPDVQAAIAAIEENAGRGQFLATVARKWAQAQKLYQAAMGCSWCWPMAPRWPAWPQSASPCSAKSIRKRVKWTFQHNPWIWKCATRVCADHRAGRAARAAGDGLPVP